jgi:integrase
MPRLRLTTLAVERLRVPEKGQVEYFDMHLPGFGLRVSYSGAKAWVVMTRINGKLVRVTLGRYPALSLADAREKARKVVEHARAGTNPRQIEADRRRQQEQSRRSTFDYAASLFMERHVRPRLRPKTTREYRRLLQGSDTGPWRALPISAITKVDIIDVLQRIDDRGSPAASNRSLAYLSKFFNWCLEQDLISISPTARVRALSPTRPRERVLTLEELNWIWRALQGYPGVFGTVFKILLLTGQRRSEVSGMRWDELRGLGSAEALWELPSERTKNGQRHLVPLARPVCEILSRTPHTGPLVFTTTSRTSISGFSKAKMHLVDRIAMVRAEPALPPLPAWTLHDFRRTMVTMMNERLGTSPHVVEAIVNHVSGPAKRGVAGVYNRAVYLQERRIALESWADLVRS